ncbi:mCG1030897, partial [Mus musculus]
SWVSWNSLFRPGWPRTQKSACLCLPSAGIKGMHHHRPASPWLTTSISILLGPLIIILLLLTFEHCILNRLGLPSHRITFSKLSYSPWQLFIAMKKHIMSAYSYVLRCFGLNGKECAFEGR